MPHCWRMTGMGLGSISSFREARSRRIGLTTGFWAWYPGKPGKTQKRAVASLFAGKAPKIRIEKLPDADWLVLSQQEVEPIRAGRFGPNPRIPAFTRGGKFCNSTKPSNT